MNIDLQYIIKNLFEKDEKCSIWQAQLIFQCSLIMNIIINYQELFMSKICILVLTITALYSLKIV